MHLIGTVELTKEAHNPNSTLKYRHEHVECLKANDPFDMLQELVGGTMPGQTPTWTPKAFR